MFFTVRNHVGTVVSIHFTSASALKRPCRHHLFIAESARRGGAIPIFTVRSYTDTVLCNCFSSTSALEGRGRQGCLILRRFQRTWSERVSRVRDLSGRAIVTGSLGAGYGVSRGRHWGTDGDVGTDGGRRTGTDMISARYDLYSQNYTEFFCR